MRQQPNPAVMQAQLKAKMKQAEQMDKELELKKFRSEDPDCLVEATGLAQISELGFRLDNGESLSIQECSRLLFHLNRALRESYEFRNRVAQQLFGSITRGT